MLLQLAPLLVFLLGWGGSGAAKHSSRNASSEAATSVILERQPDIYTVTNHDKFARYSAFLNSSEGRGIMRNKQNSTVLLFIGVTSGHEQIALRKADRETWLLACVTSSLCDYRFFIDILWQLASPTLREESGEYGDVVFRDSCSLMLERHPDNNVNYKTAPPVKEHLAKSDSGPGKSATISIPDYKYRRFYRVDWKICFMRWAAVNYHHVKYHVYSEDDSFVCVGNLLYQLQCLEARRANATAVFNETVIKPWRTGTAMFDGFDDSSTLMSGDLALLFVANYPQNPLLRCRHILDSNDSKVLQAASFLSWGNSWMKAHCNWKKAIHEATGVAVNTPSVNCLQSFAKGGNKHFSLSFPCSSTPLILHHHFAGEVLIDEMGETRLQNICKNIFFADKIKIPNHIRYIWDHVLDMDVRDNSGRDVDRSNHTYVDFSSVLMHDYGEGWRVVVEQYGDRLFRESDGFNRKLLLASIGDEYI